MNDCIAEDLLPLATDLDLLNMALIFKNEMVWQEVNRRLQKYDSWVVDGIAHAAANRKIRRLQYLLDRFPPKSSDERITSLECACRSGCVDTVKMLATSRHIGSGAVSTAVLWLVHISHTLDCAAEICAVLLSSRTWLETADLFRLYQALKAACVSDRTDFVAAILDTVPVFSTADHPKLDIFKPRMWSKNRRFEITDLQCEILTIAKESVRILLATRWRFVMQLMP